MTSHYEEREGNRSNDKRWTREPRPERDRDFDPHHDTSQVPADYRQVKGWGVDLHNRPMVPMELPSTVMTARGDVREWQEPQHKHFVSVEHPNLTPVFGETSPPRGLSGALRAYAYRYGEGTNRHWMTLILADRVDMMESMVIDALRGRPDNIPKEKGWGARIKYARTDERTHKGAVTAIVIGALAVGLFMAASKRR